MGFKMIRCSRCGRPLKSQKAIENGMGSHCMKMMEIKDSNHTSIYNFFEDGKTETRR